MLHYSSLTGLPVSPLENYESKENGKCFYPRLRQMHIPAVLLPIPNCFFGHQMISHLLYVFFSCSVKVLGALNRCIFIWD